jgi:hypothetical protein
MNLGTRLADFDSRALAPIDRGYRRFVAGRTRPRGLTVIACLTVAAALSVAVWQADRAAPAADMSAGEVVRVGVEQGGSIPAYAESSGRELTQLVAAGGPESYALVTFAAYLAPARLTPILGGVSVATVYVRVPLPGAQTEIVRIPATRVPIDVVTGMEQVADRKAREAADYSARLIGSSDTALAEVYRSGARVASAERDAYASHCACAYAAVVRATPAALQRIADLDGVRIVDVAPEVRRLDRAVFSPPLPEQTDRATPPQDSRG